MATKSGRTISNARELSLKSLIVRWEFLLILIFVAVNIMNANLSPVYLNEKFLFINIRGFMVKGILALPMAYILLLGDIDLSVGGNVCLSATVLGIVYNTTGNMVLAIAACLLTGTLCGALNGILLTKFTELAPMIVTLATNIIFRGISERILGDGSTGGMQEVEWFTQLYYGRVAELVPYLVIIFCVLALVFGLVMHKTVFGRQMFAIGANKKAAAYAGVKVEKIRMIVFTLTGLVCGFAAVFDCANMGSVKSNLAKGYELEAIAMCVLGGISTAGGKGTMVGAVISIFIIGLLRYGLGLANFSGQTIRIILGALLIAVVLYPTIQEAIKNRFAKKAQ
ncbi:MAG: ABC transporter permease [Ruminococcaceae bacterium]|nr:ABC transporter permease [Oscillospiraceae bacterium]